MKKAFYAKLIVGAALLQTAVATGLSCLGNPVQGAPIHRLGGDLQAALQQFLGT